MIILAPLIGLAFVVFGIVQSGARPQPLLYAFVLNYVAQLITIEAMMAMHRRARSDLTRRLLTLLSSPPEAGRHSLPIVNEQTGRPLGLGGYLAVTAALTLFAVVLASVNEDRDPDLDAVRLRHDLNWACLLAGVYWVQNLVSRSIVIDFNVGREVNYGYNTGEMAVLAAAVLTAGVVAVARRNFGLGASGWVVLAPLLGWRALYDFSMGATLARRTDSPGGSP